MSRDGQQGASRCPPCRAQRPRRSVIPSPSTSLTVARHLPSSPPSRQQRTKKAGITGKYGVRYGASLRKQVKKMEISQHSKYTCVFCGKDTVKRACVAGRADRAEDGCGRRLHAHTRRLRGTMLPTRRPPRRRPLPAAVAAPARLRLLATEAFARRTTACLDASVPARAHSRSCPRRCLLRSQVRSTIRRLREGTDL